MSGTSMDGVDAVAVTFTDNKVHLLNSLTAPYPSNTKEQLHKTTNRENKFSLEQIAHLDILVGNFFAKTAIKLLEEAQLSAGEVIAIGSHGQTISHNINGNLPFTWQIGNPANIAANTGITTIADFRSLDVAMGGQGAPLVPAFHEYQFSSKKCDRVIVNVGGIANISILKKNAKALIGYDTGPGNCLMDDWFRVHMRGDFDKDGKWAKSGKIIESLLDEMLKEPYFQLKTSKSTSRELFSLPYLTNILKSKKEWVNASAEDVQATLLSLTVSSIIKEIKLNSIESDLEIYICGGGASNGFLISKFQEKLPNQQVKDTGSLGIDPDFVEAAAFAWLAKQRVSESPIKLITGGKRQQLVLGAVYSPSF